MYLYIYIYIYIYIYLFIYLFKGLRPPAAGPLPFVLAHLSLVTGGCSLQACHGWLLTAAWSLLAGYCGAGRTGRAGHRFRSLGAALGVL